MYEKLLLKLNKVSPYALDLYMGFLGYGSVSVFDASAAGKALNEKLSQYDRYGGMNSALHIYRDDDARLSGDYDGISTTQFLYDIDVFSRIHPEIAVKITTDSFTDFAERMFLKCNDNQFSVYYTKETKLARCLDLAGADPIPSDSSIAGTAKILIYSTGNRCLAEEFYKKYKSEKRIEILYILQLIREWIIELTGTYLEEYFLSRGVAFYLLNWNSAQQNILPAEANVTSEIIEEREKYGIKYIRGSEDHYADFLKDVYGDDYSPEYACGVFDIPPKIELYNGYVRHIDRSGKYMNIHNGEKLTPGQSDNAGNSIFLLGGCVFFGYAIDDRNTVSSQMQSLINGRFGKGRWNVRNYAAWGGNLDDMFGVLYNVNIRKGDIIAVSYAGFMPVGDIDVSVGLGSVKSGKEFYFDTLLHCNKSGYGVIAERLISILGNKLDAAVYERDIPVNITDKYSKGISGSPAQNFGFENYIR